MAGGKLSKLREGIPLHKNVILGSGASSVKVAVVLLANDLMQLIDEQTEEYCNENKNKVNARVRDYYHNRLMSFHCMRDIDDPTYQTKIADSIEEVAELDLEDIKRVTNAYSELLLNKAPKLELLTQENLDELKKHLEVTQLSDLSTVLLVHLRSCHQTIVSEC